MTKGKLMPATQVKPRQHELWSHLSERKPAAELKDAPLDTVPPCDSWETASHFVFCLDMPGLDASAIGVEIQGAQVRVAADRRALASGETGVSCVDKQECHHGHFGRTLELPLPVDPRGVSATYHEGILQIVIPKGTSEPATRIEVRQTEHTLPTAPCGWLEDSSETEPDFSVNDEDEIC